MPVATASATLTQGPPAEILISSQLYEKNCFEAPNFVFNAAIA